MANSTRLDLDRDADPCHVLWQVNQIAAQALRLTRMVQPAERKKRLRTRMAEMRTNAIDTHLSAGLIHLPDEPARGLRPVRAPEVSLRSHSPAPQGGRGLEREMSQLVPRSVLSALTHPTVLDRRMTLLGAREEQVESVSLGEEKPSCMEQNDACWAKNRRGDMLYNGEF